MNIREAKEEISNTLRAYHEKNEQGEYVYPVVRQRPILLMGPPGIGKTAIMEQIARENEVGLVSYTITHHTRQSAIGLPRIREREYEGEKISVTEYTMSEIIDSVYAAMEKTKKKEGILFIDEINCASETLAPTMLQFLQNKTFGSHRAPEGWMIVAAGNPPEYNKSVREFDIVTLDRIRRIDIEVDCGIWLEYARSAGVHGSILSYLGMKKDRFYLVENLPDEKNFVTARGWEDLSEMLKSYERLKIPVTEQQVVQFLQKEEAAREFTSYYRLYCKYGQDYGVSDVVKGMCTPERIEAKRQMALHGGFEERFTLVELFLACMDQELFCYQQKMEQIKGLHEALMRYHKEKSSVLLEEFADKRKKSLEVRKKAGLLSLQEIRLESWLIRTLSEYDLQIRMDHITDPEAGFERIRALFALEVKAYQEETRRVQEQLQASFDFLASCFADGQEMVLFVTGLSRNERAMLYISEHGCDAFFAHSGKLLYQKRRDELLKACLDELEEE